MRRKDASRRFQQKPVWCCTLVTRESGILDVRMLCRVSMVVSRFWEDFCKAGQEATERSKQISSHHAKC